MGYCEGGDLYTKLKDQGKRKEHLSEKQIVEWFVQIAMALQVIMLHVFCKKPGSTNSLA